MWIIFKVFIEFVTILLLCFVWFCCCCCCFFFGPEACGILPPWLGIRLLCPALEVYGTSWPLGCQGGPRLQVLKFIYFGIELPEMFPRDWTSLGIHNHMSVSSDRTAAFDPVVHHLFSVSFKLAVIPTHHLSPGVRSLVSRHASFLWLQ